MHGNLPNTFQIEQHVSSHFVFFVHTNLNKIEIGFPKTGILPISNSSNTKKKVS